MAPNRNLLIPYATPYFAYVGIGTIFGRFMSLEAVYAIRIIAIPVVLLVFRKHFFSPKGPYGAFASVLTGLFFGIAGAAIWVVLLKPFVAESDASVSALLFVLKITSIVLIVPIFEEYFMRGYIFRLSLQWETAKREGSRRPLERALDKESILRVENGAWSYVAVLISSVCFTVGHPFEQWLAAFVYSLMICLVYILRKDLLSCICSHAVTNLSLSIYAGISGKWAYW